MRGVLLSEALDDERITTEELAYLTDACTVNWSIPFSKPGSDELRRCFLVWKQAHEDGWCRQEWRRAVDQFVKRVKFATWTLADFFDGKRPMVYGHAWMREHWAKHGPTEIGTYDLKGRPVWGWRRDIDGLLPEWEPEHVPDEPSPDSVDQTVEAPRSDVMDADTRQRYDAIMDDLRSGVALEEEQRKTMMLRAERRHDQRTIDELRAENESLRLQLQATIDRNAEAASRG